MTKNIREILQSYCIIIIGLVDVVLLLRFFLDFYGVDKNQSFIKIIFSISKIFYSPFKDTFEATQTTESMTTDYSVIVALVAYSVFAGILLVAVKIFFRWDVKNKATTWMGVFFKFFIALNIFRLVLILLHAQESKFMNFLKVSTAITVVPIRTVIPSTDDPSVDISASLGISIVMLILVWYTVYRIMKATVEKKTGFDLEPSEEGEKEDGEEDTQKIIYKKEEAKEEKERPLVYVPLSQQQGSVPNATPSQTQSQAQPETPLQQPSVQPQQAREIQQPQPTQEIPTQQNTQQVKTVTPQQAQSLQAEQQQVSEPQEIQQESVSQPQEPTDPQQVSKEGKVKSFIKKMAHKEPGDTFIKKKAKPPVETPRSPLG